jgi:integrase
LPTTPLSRFWRRALARPKSPALGPTAGTNALGEAPSHPPVGIASPPIAKANIPKLTKRTIDDAELLEADSFLWDDGIGEMPREMEAGCVGSPSAVLAARLLILTGCRLDEIMTQQWDYIDFDERAWRLPDSKTGKKIVHLGTPAVEYLQDARRIDSNPWVITSTLPGKPLNDLQPFWQQVRAWTGVKEVRIHDLRHTLASAAVSSGQGFPMIGKLLSHTQVRTKQRYAHLLANPFRAGLELVGDMLRAKPMLVA